MLFGAPMGGAYFVPLAERLAADHTVITTDPRGIGRSPVDDPDRDTTPEMRADDLSRLLTQLDAGPAAVFGSSGGAVSALALALAQPGQVHTVVAHEPPLQDLLEDREERHAAVEDMIATYLSGDVHRSLGEVPGQAGIAVPEAVSSEMSAANATRRRSRTSDFWFAHMLRAITRWQPDIAALRDGADPRSWSASARRRPAGSATARRPRSPGTRGSSRRPSPAATSASPRTRTRSLPGCVRCCASAERPTRRGVRVHDASAWPTTRISPGASVS